MRNIHGGDIKSLARQAGRPASEICDFSANINPLGPPEWLRSVISRSVADVVHYPDPECRGLVAAIADKYKVSPEEIVVGNGASEIIQTLPRVAGSTRAVIAVPSYLEYGLACEAAGLEVEKVFSDENLKIDLTRIEAEIEGGEIVFLANPNNPTGLMLDRERLKKLAEKYRKTLFVVDEAFIEFAGEHHSLLHARPENVIVLRSMTKFYAIPGIRLGFAVAEKNLVANIKQALPPWSVNTFAQRIGKRALDDVDYADRTVATVAQNRAWLTEKLSRIPTLYVYPSEANFLLVKVGKTNFRASEFARRLLQRYGIAIRVCDNYDRLGNKYFRIAVKSRKDNKRLRDAIAREFGVKAKPTGRTKTPAIMFQGCGSSAGKSFLSTALCRVLLQDGLKVAPFKAQNMSLNSFVTRDGREMGRAQAVQAQASKLDPDARMNPVLLKPNTDTGSQVLVMGKPVGNMKVAEYTSCKAGLFERVQEAYDSLASEYEAVVLEGAGSPAEINLKADDIVNMRMARHAQSPVLLTGDIDRGGVFAAFIGCMETMQEWERELMAGFIVNRFRGDSSLLEPALEYTEYHTSKPVLGVVPYIETAGIPEEDSVQFKAGGFQANPTSSEEIDIVVVDLGHISNFTDFDPFLIEPDVKLRVAKRAAEIGNPDAVVIPGSKNVLADMARLKENGMAEATRDIARAGKPEIAGICAGFQMLGMEIKDPCQIESRQGQSTGIGLLDVETVLAEEKTLRLTKARHCGSGIELKGYEIHHGQTNVGGDEVALEGDDGEILGVQAGDGRIWGTYLHGVFDDDSFRRWFIDRLRTRKGLEAMGKICARYDLEESFDRLAHIFRKSVDMDKLYKILGY